MELTFKEWLEEDILIESFEITNNYKRLSKHESDKYWMKILDIGEDLLPSLYTEIPYLKSYIFKNEGREYLIYTYIINSVLEIHFNDMNIVLDGKESDDKGLTKNSQSVFSAVMSIVLTELEERPNRKIKISTPKNRLKLYKKIIDKTLKKYNIEKHIFLKTSKDSYNKEKYDFLLEKEQTKICIGIE